MFSFVFQSVKDFLMSALVVVIAFIGVVFSPGGLLQILTVALFGMLGLVDYFLGTSISDTFVSWGTAFNTIWGACVTVGAALIAPFFPLDILPPLIAIVGIWTFAMIGVRVVFLVKAHVPVVAGAAN